MKNVIHGSRMLESSWFQRLTTAPPGVPVLLERLTWPEVQALLDAGTDMAILPVGATEQHGPHLPINTDTVIADATCAYASALTGIPLLPALTFTVSLGQTEKWPGTFSLYHDTFISTVREIARWAVATGWKRLLLINSHFGNDAALRVAVDRIRFDFAGALQVAARNTFSLTDEIWSYFRSDAEDLHANQAETDLMLFLAPENVRMDVVEDDPDRTGGKIFPHMVPFTSTNGVTGMPSRGSAERGEALLVEMGSALAEVIERARHEAPPLSWKRTTTAFAC
jgi:creatinine amidohydrolase